MKNENENETENNNNLNEISNDLKKNPFFKEGLFIEIPEDDSSINNEGCFSKKGSYLENISINTPCDRFLSKSLIKKIEEGTPVENIKIDLEKLKISDEFVTNVDEESDENKTSPSIKNINSNQNNINDDNIGNEYDYGKNNNNNFNNNNSYNNNNNVNNNNNNNNNNVNNNKNNNCNNNKNNNCNNNNNNKNNNDNNDNNLQEKNVILKEEDYIFEKFGKSGWECNNCNNFNFKSRTKCNRCGIEKFPKLLSKIKKENEEKILNGERKKKPLIEREGDWLCSNCHNLNFAFRTFCNRCKLFKDNNNNNNINNNINNNNINNNNINNNNINNDNNNRQNTNTQNNNSQSGNNENVYGNIMSQFLNPNNLNNLVGMVDNMLTGSGNNRRNNNQQQNQSSGNNLFSNFLNGFMSGLSGLDSSDEENENEDRKEEEKKEEIKKEEKKEEEIKKEEKNEEIKKVEIKKEEKNEEEKKEEIKKEEKNEEIKKGEIKKEKKKEEIKKEETQKEDEKKEEIKNEITTKKPDLNLLRKLMQSPSTRKSTTLNNIKEVAILNPNKEFELFTNKIISNLTLQEIVNLNSIKISGFTRQRKEIQLLINDISSIKTITELIIERIILDEDSNNKLKQDNNNFDIEKFFNDNLKELIEIILNKEISDNEWEDKVLENLIKIIYKFYIELSNIYTSGKDGAKFCLLFNFENILNDLVGEDFVKVMKDYDENVLSSFIDNLIFNGENLELKNKLKNNNNQLLSIDQIFNVAFRDKKILEEEAKKKNNENKEENNHNENEEDKFSEFYYRTSLFQS